MADNTDVKSDKQEKWDFSKIEYERWFHTKCIELFPLRRENDVRNTTLKFLIH